MPNNAIYAFWDDLIPSGGDNGNVYVKTVDASTFVIEWHQVRQLGTANYQTFEIVLADNNRIKLQYQTITNTVSTTVGVENSSGTVAQQYFCNGSGSVLENELANEYTTP